MRVCFPQIDHRRNTNVTLFLSRNSNLPNMSKQQEIENRYISRDDLVQLLDTIFPNDSSVKIQVSHHRQCSLWSIKHLTNMDDRKKRMSS